MNKENIEANKSASSKKCPECFAEVPAQAKKCSHCGSKLPQPTSLVTKIVAGFFALSTLFAIISISMSDGSPSSEPARPNYELSALAYSELYIKRVLKSPSTADFCAGTVTDLGNNRWEVSSCVDSQNSFGAMIRSNWDAIMVYTGGDPDSIANWDPEKIIFDGKVIYPAR